MNTEAKRRQPSPAVFAEAAAWMARLHGPNRTLQAERGFRRWLEGDAAHAAAFEAMTATWEVTGKMPKRPFAQLSRWQRAGYREGFIRSAAAVAAAAVLAAGVFFYSRDAAIETSVGEQRTLTLEDGSRVVLNTDTRIEVEFDRNARSVRLLAGEALFEVARHADRPFVVAAGRRHIRALGTVFLVRSDERQLAVTLLEGKVAVEPQDGAGGQSSILTAGERFLLADGAGPAIDQPAMEKVTAWRRGLVDFDGTPLGEAAAEMNRYSATRLVIQDPRAARIRIDGVFRTGDNVSFAAAVSRAYGLEVVDTGDAIRLVGAPVSPGR